MPSIKQSIVIFFICLEQSSFAFLLPLPVKEEIFLAEVPPLKENPPIATWGQISTLTIAAVFLPAMTFLGALVANPQWSVVSGISSYRAKISYIDHTTSLYTVPVTALFALLGTAPLWGIFFTQGVR